ncbi:MAG: hypothetical protein RJA57_875 [Bacteroidota bacterium]|jgi:hypothetical protein
MPKRPRYLAVLFWLLFPVTLTAQDRPRLIQQVALEQIEDAVSDPGGRTLLLKSGTNTYTLVDQVSKIQLGTVQLDIGMLAIPGMGRFYLSGSHRFILSNGEQLLEYDFITGRTDTVFRTLTFPEFIVAFVPLPGDPSRLLLFTKTYPIDARGTVQFMKRIAGDRTIYDDTRKGRALIYDLVERRILRSQPLPFVVTDIDASDTAMWAGTFDGDLVRIDTALNLRQRIHAFDTAVHSIRSLQGVLVAVPHIAPKYIGNEGTGRLFFYTAATGEQRWLRLPEQSPEPADRWAMQPSPSSQVKRIWPHPASSSFLVNYGFSRLLQVRLPSFDTVSFPVPFTATLFLCFNRDSTQLLAAASERLSVFGVSGSLLFYGLRRQRTESYFRRPSAQERYDALFKVWDKAGNYHLIGQRADTLVIHSSNRTSPAFLIGQGKPLLLDPADTTLALRYNGRLVVGRLMLEQLTRTRYRLSLQQTNFPDPGDQPDSLPAALFRPLLDIRKNERTDIPYMVTQVKRIGPIHFMIVGYDRIKEQDQYRVQIVDTAGRTVFRQPLRYNPYLNEPVRVSPSGTYLVFCSPSATSMTLDVWDWRKGQKRFSRTLAGKESIDHTCFDRSRDICWFLLDRGGDIGRIIYQVDPAAPVVRADPVILRPSFGSFETDLDKDLMAVDAYDRIALQRISSRQVLWQRSPFSSGFCVRHLQDGFSWSSEYEQHVLTGRNDHLQFISFVPFRPVEILNGYQYRGEKQAINNLAYVYREKGSLPGDLDRYFNRPDSVLLRSGSVNRSWNQSLERAVARRFRYEPAQGLHEMLMGGPVLEILNREKIPDQVAGSQWAVSVRVRVRPGDTLRTLQVSGNGVPLFGPDGLDWPCTGTGDSLLRIPLVNGVNTIELVAETRGGLRSVPELIAIQASFDAPAPRTWFVGIGVSQYRDTTMNLRYADKDVRDLAALFAQLHPNGSTDTLLNGSVTRSAVLALRERLMHTAPEDQVIISFNGHGLVDSAGRFYFAPHDMDFDVPDRKGILFEEMEGLLAGIPARKRLLWIDACHSGELDREALDTALTGASTAVSAYSGKRGGIVVVVGNATGSQASFELMRELFSHTGNRSGAIVISAAGGLEFAFEDAKWQNGVFTYSIRKGLQEKAADRNGDGRVSVNELREYVSLLVEQLTGGRQRPATRRELTETDWFIR